MGLPPGDASPPNSRGGPVRGSPSQGGMNRPGRALPGVRAGLTGRRPTATRTRKGAAVPWEGDPRTGPEVLQQSRRALDGDPRTGPEIPPPLASEPGVR